MPVPQAVRGYIKLLPLAVVVVRALGLPAIARASDDSNKPTPKGQSLDGPLTPEGAAKSFQIDLEEGIVRDMCPGRASLDAKDTHYNIGSSPTNDSYVER
jgi:hypothetical protein